MTNAAAFLGQTDKWQEGSRSNATNHTRHTECVTEKSTPASAEAPTKLRNGKMLPEARKRGNQECASLTTLQGGGKGTGQLEHLWPCHSYHPAAVTTGHGLPLRCACGDRWHVLEGQFECLCDRSVTELAFLFLSQPQRVDLVWVSRRKSSVWTSSARHTPGPGTHFLCAQDSPGLLMKVADPDSGVPGGPRNLHTDQIWVCMIWGICIPQLLGYCYSRLTDCGETLPDYSTASVRPCLGGFPLRVMSTAPSMIWFPTREKQINAN